MIKHALAFISVFLLLNMAASGMPAGAVSGQAPADSEEAIDYHCLREAYPQIKNFEKGLDGKKWLVLANGQKVLYSEPLTEQKTGSLEGTVAESMSQAYPLEPQRPPTPPGFAPGRKRSYALLAALYGEDAPTVKSALVTARLRGGLISLSPAAASAFSRAIPALENFVAENPAAGAFLKPYGGFFWRKIAGESSLSAHAFGIALDIGADKAPYWRWSRKMPHPMQQTYPSEIVGIMEEQGFIWGGKWHEYDLMHFEYRPELICKSRLLRGFGW